MYRPQTSHNTTKSRDERIKAVGGAIVATNCFHILWHQFLNGLSVVIGSLVLEKQTIFVYKDKVKKLSCISICHKIYKQHGVTYSDHCNYTIVYITIR